MLTLTTTTTRTETLRDNAAAPDVRNLVSHTIDGRGLVTVGGSHIQISDPYGEESRREFIYYSDSGAVLDAIVDYVAALHREVIRAVDRGDLEANRSAQCQAERLRRIAGAMGLTYGAPISATVEAE
jgi:hypothetical protein